MPTLLSAEQNNDDNSGKLSFNESEVIFSYHPTISEYNFGGAEAFGEEAEFYIHANETNLAPSLRAGVEFFRAGHSLAIAIPEMLRLIICWHHEHKNIKDEDKNKRHINRCRWRQPSIQAALQNFKIRKMTDFAKSNTTNTLFTYFVFHEITDATVFLRILISIVDHYVNDGTVCNGRWVKMVNRWIKLIKNVDF